MPSIWRLLKQWYVFVLPLRFNAVVLAILLFAFRYSDQGLDILRALSQTGKVGLRLHFALFLVASMLLALQLWYWSRHLLRYRPNGAPLPDDFPVTTDWLPRLMGLAVFAIEIAGFVRVRDHSHVFGWIIGFLIVFAILYLAFVVGRRALITGGRSVVTTFNEFDRTTRVVLYVSVIAEVILFAWATAAPVSWKFFGVAATLVLTVAVWVPLGTLLVGIGEKARFPVFTALLLWAFLISRCTDNHDIRTRGAAQQRPTMAAAFQQWYDRVAPQHAGGEVPVIIVATEGGGIRAAYWTATVLTQLQDEIPQFSDHVFAISGVSGGSLGALLFDAILLRHERDTTRVNIKPDVAAMLKHDALSGTLAAMAQPDLF